MLDVGHTSPGAFDDQTLAVLQTVANHLAAVIENASLLETTRLSLNQVSSLYQASYQMARAASPDEVLRITIAACADALKQSTQMQTGPGAGLIAFFMPEGKSLRRMAVFQPDSPSSAVGAHGVRPHGVRPHGARPPVGLSGANPPTPTCRSLTLTVCPSLQTSWINVLSPASQFSSAPFFPT